MLLTKLSDEDFLLCFGSRETNKKLSYQRDGVHRHPYTMYCEKLDCLGFMFVADSMGLTSVNLMQWSLVWGKPLKCWTVKFGLKN